MALAAEDKLKIVEDGKDDMVPHYFDDEDSLFTFTSSIYKILLDTKQISIGDYDRHSNTLRQREAQAKAKESPRIKHGGIEQ